MSKLVAIGKKVVRTPEALAKFHLKNQAKALLESANLPGTAKVIIRYGAHSAEFDATPTVNLGTGQIMFHHGGKMPCRIGDMELTLQNGGNISLGLGVEGFADVVAKYAPEYARKNGIKAGTAEAASEEDLDAGETTE
jgi:hypothetical protein